MKVTEKDVAPGKIFYGVYGVNGKKCKNAQLGGKIIATSRIYTCHNIDSPRFDCIEIFDTWENKNGHQYCNDRAMMIEGKLYNLNRLFHTKEEALDFVEQCHSGVFKDPLDQEYYEKSMNEPDFDDYWWFS